MHNGRVDTADPLTGLVGFAAALRVAGLPADAQRVQAYLGAVGELDVADPGQLYWAGRLTLCAEPDDLPRYDEAFAAWFTADDLFNTLPLSEVEKRLKQLRDRAE